MIYYPQGKELETVSELFRGSVNDAVVCRDRLSASGALYTVLVIRDRTCARTMLDVMEHNERNSPTPCLMCTAQNEELLFLFPYREQRSFASFAKGQITTPDAAEDIAIGLVMECLACGLPWPLLYQVLEQGKVHIAKDNGIYFTMDLDLKSLDPTHLERSCVSSCARLVLDILSAPVAGNRRSRRKQLKSFELIWKKSSNGTYRTFPEFYQDIRLTALPKEKLSLKNRIKGVWQRNKDILFRLLLVLCILVGVVALSMLLTQVIFGDIPWLRVFQHTFDVIGTENLHLGGHI